MSYSQEKRDGKKQRHPASHKSQHRIDILHPVLSSQNQKYVTSQQEATPGQEGTRAVGSGKALEGKQLVRGR